VSEPTSSPGRTDGPAGAMRGEPGFRTPPEDFAAAAAAAPGHWLSVVDRHWIGGEEEIPPPWAVLGHWRSDEHGEIVEWQENSGYRASPDALGWAPPVSPVDAAVQRVATGYVSEQAFAMAVSEAEVAVCVDGEGRPALTEAPDGTTVVSVFPAAPQLDRDRLPAHRMMPVPALLDRLPEDCAVMFLSSSAPVAQIAEADTLRTGGVRLRRYAAEFGEGGGPETGGRPDPFMERSTSD
jgi:hypothetical protein